MFDDGACAAQGDSFTCGLHAVYNATLLACRCRPLDPPRCAVGPAANIVVYLPHAAPHHRDATCFCSIFVSLRAVLGFLRLVDAVSLALAKPSELRGALQ
jgi:hypothetical protein